MNIRNGRINTVKTSTRPKATYGFNAISISTPTPFFTKVAKTFLKFTWESQKTPKAKETLRKNKAGVITRPDFKLYCKAIVVKITWCWRENRQTAQGSRTDSPEMNPVVHVD